MGYRDIVEAKMTTARIRNPSFGSWFSSTTPGTVGTGAGFLVVFAFYLKPQLSASQIVHYNNYSSLRVLRITLRVMVVNGDPGDILTYYKVESS
jgi:hypothetical protein